MVSAPLHSAPNVFRLVPSRAGRVRNSPQQQAGSVYVSIFISSGSSSGCSVNSTGQALGVCLYPNCADATSGSQVGELKPVSNATVCSSSALLAVASNGTQVASGLSSGGGSIATTLETASASSIPQPSRTGSSFRVELTERNLRERQFSEAVAHRLCQTVRASTAGIYDCECQEFMNVGVVQNRLACSNPLFRN